MTIVVIITEIIAPIAIIDTYPVPKATIKIGPNATFGIAFKTTKYGSSMFERRSDHHKSAAIKTPKTVPIINPSTVSNNVTARLLNRLPSFILSKNRFQTFEGALKIKGSIQWLRLAISQNPKKTIKIRI